MNVTNSSQEEDQHQRQHLNQHLNPNPASIENEEEPVVTSTSNDLSQSSPVHVQQQPPQHSIESVITSPPRITSSTGNDCSISPPLRQQQRVHPQQEELQSEQHAPTGKYKIDLTADGSSEDDSNFDSQNEFSSSVLTQQQQRGVNVADAVMPTTSANAVVANNLNPNSNPCIRYKDNPELVSNTAAEPGDMVARNLSAPAIADSDVCGNAIVDNATPSEVPVSHKIILKLPRPSTAKSESQMDVDPTTSSSSSNSSNNSCTRGEDTRKVEPLKINLHNTHGTMQQHNVPKITIKPIIKKPAEETDASCSSSADDDPPIPKLTIKSSTTAVQHCSTSSEPHIVPKLTIRSASSEEGSGASHSASILPRLTIKMSDAQSTSSSATHNNVLSANCSTVAGNLLKSPASMTSSAGSTPSPLSQQPPEQAPLPKLTIKTSIDGTSNSILSHISPASLSSSSTSSSSSASIATSPLPPTPSSIPKLTIKNIPKPEELVVPKLTIKTNAAGNSECASTSSVAEEDPTASKIPKLTIKTGQEHAVIITQHSAATHSQSIPKLTIKTKSLDVVESATGGSSQVDHSDEPPPEKIPKITIKTNETLDKTTDAPKFCIKTTQSTEQPPQLQPTIPKLTITVSNIDFGGNGVSVTPGADRGPQSPLVVRQLPGTSRKTATKSTSPERVPKLMISRQDSGSSNPVLMVSNHSNDAATTDTKFVPKLTIKTSSLPDTSESKDSKTAKFSIKTLKAVSEEEKVPKLTIKSVTTATAPTAVQHLSEDSDECVSLSSCSSPVPQDEKTSNTKIVPKLTIKNLSSPQPTVKTVVNSTLEINMPASKKCPKNIAPKNDISATANESTENAADLPQELMEINDTEETVDEAFAVVTSVSDVRVTLPSTNGGESNSSQEFCGFNDNTTDSNIEEANLNPLNMDEEKPRRQSDDMDIDEALQQQHSPQMFNNVGHFSNSNEEDSSVATADQQSKILSRSYLLAPIKHPKLTHVIDTVDLTSSPSPGSSPAHFNYADTDAAEVEQPRASDFLLERLQQHRETSVIQQATTANSHSILLSQLTSHPNTAVAVDNRTENTMLPVLQAKPDNCISNSEKYPHLTERLLANGIVHTNQTMHSGTNVVMPTPANVILDSIEILDTPDGSPHYSLDEEPVKLSHHMHNMGAGEMLTHQLDNCKDVDNHINNNNMMPTSHANLKRHVVPTRNTVQEVNHLERESLQISPNKLRRIENDSSTMATITILTNDIQEPNTTVITTSPTMIQSNHCRDVNNEAAASPTISVASQQALPHRSRKQKHEYILKVPDEEQDPLQLNSHDIAAVDCSSNTNYFNADATKTAAAAAELSTPTLKRRGRPRKGKNTTPLSSARQHRDTDSQRVNEQNSATPAEEEKKMVKSRLSRVQLLRKRLAIDMVDTEQPPPILDKQQPEQHSGKEPSFDITQAARRDRILRTPLRTSRLSATPHTLFEGRDKRNHEVGTDTRKLQRKKSITETSILNHHHQHFGGGSNSSMSSCSTSSLSSTTTAAVTMAAQIDLTMSSSSSSNGSNTVTTVGAGGNRAAHSMLPPTTILSSSDPLADVVFRPNDFSSLVAAQQLRSPIRSRRTSAEEANMLLTPTLARSRKGSRTDSQEDDGGTGGSGADNSGDDSASSCSAVTPGRGRGRGRGRSSGRGSSNSARGGTRTTRIGRGASSVTKAIAMSRPRCVGGLKHTPDPERIKGLFSPAPQVFEEDTRMSADLNQVLQVTELTQTSVNRQLDFLTNEESQSSIISTNSILDPNTVAAVQNGAHLQKRPKKKKMEVCVAEDTEFTVGSIAEYDWPPPKGCCPSKNRDTFMIQEQVALYLGIKSFKRKYPDLPRRQVDMEERNWLQEKGLVSEKMCDLGITAVWASDVLDIMYTDFHEKYEEYKEFIRQKHVREIESKQKALGLNVMGRGLQARDRAMLSASKWNSYFNKSRKEERHKCLDLQTLTVNLPLPCDAAAKITVDRPMIDAVVAAIEEAGISETPPTLLKPSLSENPSFRPLISYPLALVPGQYCEKYRHYTPLELRSYPINTVLDDPGTLHERLNQVPSSIQTGSDTDTESATETTTGTVPASQLKVAFGTTYSKRVPVRRSRRARTNAIHGTTSVVSEHEITKCDTRNEEDQKEQRSNNDGSGSGEDRDASTASTTSSSESATSSSDTDSDSDVSSSSADLEAYAQCGVCQRTQNSNLKNLPEVFLKCYTCRRKVHPSCIEMPHRMTMRARNYNWQCAGCKCCIKCKRKQDQNKMLFCEQCDRGFHVYCIDVKTVPEGRWSCERCSVCMRCGATKPEGLSQSQHALVSPPNSAGGQQQQAKPVKHKKVKWINEYRIDHITKLREHCSMLCVPCGRAKTSIKRNNQYGGGAVVTNSQMSPPPARGTVAGLSIA